MKEARGKELVNKKQINHYWYPLLLLVVSNRYLLPSSASFTVTTTQVITQLVVNGAFKKSPLKMFSRSVTSTTSRCWPAAASCVLAVVL